MFRCFYNWSFLKEMQKIKKSKTSLFTHFFSFGYREMSHTGTTDIKECKALASGVHGAMLVSSHWVFNLPSTRQKIFSLIFKMEWHSMGLFSGAILLTLLSLLFLKGRHWRMDCHYWSITFKKFWCLSVASWIFY